MRRLSDQEGQHLLLITRREAGSPIRLRRAMVVLASVGGNSVPAIAHLVQADEVAIREVIHRFDEVGWPAGTLGEKVAVPVQSVATGNVHRRDGQHPP